MTYRGEIEVRTNIETDLLSFHMAGRASVSFPLRADGSGVTDIMTFVWDVTIAYKGEVVATTLTTPGEVTAAITVEEGGALPTESVAMELTGATLLDPVAVGPARISLIFEYAADLGYISDPSTDSASWSDMFESACKVEIVDDDSSEILAEHTCNSFSLTEGVCCDPVEVHSSHEHSLRVGGSLGGHSRAGLKSSSEVTHNHAFVVEDVEGREPFRLTRTGQVAMSADLDVKKKADKLDLSIVDSQSVALESSIANFALTTTSDGKAKDKIDFGDIEVVGVAAFDAYLCFDDPDVGQAEGQGKVKVRPWGFSGTYHSGGLNVAFADGSVRSVSIPWESPWFKMSKK